MKIHVHLTLQERTKKEELSVHVSGSVPLPTILREIGIPRSEIGMVVRNGRWMKRDGLVTDTDEVELFPVLSGG